MNTNLPARAAPQNPTLLWGEGEVGTLSPPPRWCWGDGTPPGMSFGGWQHRFGGPNGVGGGAWGRVGRVLGSPEAVWGGFWGPQGGFWVPRGDFEPPRMVLRSSQDHPPAGTRQKFGIFEVPGRVLGSGEDFGARGGFGGARFFWGGGGLRGRRRTTRAGSPSSPGSVWRWPRTSP